MAKFTLSDDLEKIGQELIQKYHPELEMLQIGFLYRDEAPKSARTEVLFGKAIKVDDRNWLLHKKDAIIEIERDTFELLPDQHKIMVVDHELSHIEVELDSQGCLVMDAATLRPKIRLRHHDVEEFDEIIARYESSWTEFRRIARGIIRARQGATKAGTEEALNKTATTVTNAATTQ